ncbi:MAG: hypothetical protein WDN30_07085 [Pararobbsia sp.]
MRFIDTPLFLYRVAEKSRSSEQIESGKIEESQRLIYTRNRQIYERFTENPISVFGKRMKDFGPSYAARYKRSLRYLHMAYGAVIAVGLPVVVDLLLRKPH